DNWSIKDDYIKRPEVLEYVLWKAINLDFDRFSEPKATQERMQEFKEENNTVYKFLNEYLLDVVSTRIPTKFLWDVYRSWCHENNHTIPKKSNFDKELAQNLPVGWKKEKLRPLKQFNPEKDKPDYWYDFNFKWDAEKDSQKMAVIIVKTP
ncbi:MAG TPA: hypothetical protein H9808_05310, partial [Candidatus Atopostipes pullistercoris]|nr:hypothetical protein [Candidatus Atopostipes pullistercoris]